MYLPKPKKLTSKQRKELKKLHKACEQAILKLIRDEPHPVPRADYETIYVPAKTKRG